MVTLADISKIGKPQKVVMFGAPKTGKTKLIGDLAIAGFNIIYFDLENGIGTLTELPMEAQERIQYVGLKDTYDFPVGITTSDLIVRAGQFSICTVHGNVKCASMSCKTPDKSQIVNIPKEYNIDSSKTIVVIESGTQLSASVTSWITKGRELTYQETLHDFRNNGNYLNRVLGFIQQANYNCIVTAHEIEAETEDGTVKLVPSIGSRNYSALVAKFFDHCIYTQVVNGKFKVISKAGQLNKVLTGSRLNIDTSVLTENHLVPFFKQIKLANINQQFNQETNQEIKEISNENISNQSNQVSNQSKTSNLVLNIKKSI
jgi:hypothetical protein